MHSSVRRLRAILIGVILISPTVAPAALDPTDVVQIQATANLIRDNNLFRLPDVDPTIFGINPANKADTTRVLGLGLKVDKLFSRQRLIADLNVNESKYDKNTNLDFVGGEGRLSWLWQVGNYWNGEASVRKRRQLGGFSDLRSNVQDLIDTDTYLLSAGYQVHPDWRISADLTEQDASHSAASRANLDFRSHAVGAEVRYRTKAQNSVGVQARRTDRNFPNRTTAGVATFDNGHVESRLNAVALWQVSGAMKVDGQFGRVDVQHDTLSQRDFSGTTWRAGATWDPTAKLRVSVNATKDVRLYEDIGTSYILVNSLGLSPTYAITSKIVLQGDLSYEKRNYRGDPGFLLIGTTNRDDSLRVGRINMTYTPIRNIDLSLSYETGDRRSTDSRFGFDYQSWFGTIRVGF